MKVLELFDPKPHGGHEETNDSGNFLVTKTIGDRDITFMAVSGARNTWEIVFHEFDPKKGETSMKKTGSGNEVAVFTFVMNSLRRFVEKHDPKEIHFDAEVSDENRVGLYRRMIERFGDNYWSREFKVGMGSATKRVQFDLIRIPKPMKEAMDSSYPYDFYDDNEHVTAEFTPADGTKVVVRFQHWEKPEYWEIDFKRDGKTEMTGQGDSMKVLSTVFKVIKEFLKDYQPKFFGYSANNQEDSRVAVYRRAFKRALSGSNYVEATNRLDQLDHEYMVKWYPAKKARVGNGDQPLYARKDMFL